MTQTCLYRHFDAAGRLLYVGISLSAVARLSQHMDGSSWADEIKSMTIERFPTRQEAHEAERQAIRDENPAHNLMRYNPKVLGISGADDDLEPVLDEEEALAEQHAEKARYELLRATVAYRPVYNLDAAADAISVYVGDLKWWVGRGECGHIVLGQTVRVHPTHGVPFVYRTIGMTGWQLIDLVEILQKQSATKRRILSERPVGAIRSPLFSEPVEPAPTASRSEATASQGRA